VVSLDDIISNYKPLRSAFSFRLATLLFGDRWSQLSFLIYLNDDMEGGSTTFILPEEDPTTCDVGGGAGRRSGGMVSRGVKVAQGGVLCFFHGQHPLSPLHEGSVVTAGTKYVVRSDVLYRT
jgi:hypothetical protein